MRGAVCLVIVAGAALSVYVLSARPGSVRPIRPPSEAPTEEAEKAAPDSPKMKWYARRLPDFERYAYVPLDDRTAVEAAVGGIIGDRFPGPQIDETGLTRDLSRFMYALGADDPEEYLQRAAGLRRLREDAFGDSYVHKWYRLVTGRPLSKKNAAREVLATLWTGRSPVPGRPVAMSRQGLAQAAYTRAAPAGASSTDRLASLTFPKFSMWADPQRADQWAGPFVRGCPRLTVAEIPFEQAFAAADGRLPVCHFVCAVRTAAGRVFSIEVYLYYSAANAVWNVEGLSNYFPHECCWGW